MRGRIGGSREIANKTASKEEAAKTKELFHSFFSMNDETFFVVVVTALKFVDFHHFFSDKHKKNWIIFFFSVSSGKINFLSVCFWPRKADQGDSLSPLQCYHMAAKFCHVCDFFFQLWLGKFCIVDLHILETVSLESFLVTNLAIFASVVGEILGRFPCQHCFLPPPHSPYIPPG